MSPVTLPADLDLTRRAVACKGWRWMPGMATVQGERVVLMDDDGTLRLAAPWGGTVGVTAVRSFFDSSGACLPDLDDPATGGALLVALGHEAARVRYSPSLHKQAAGVPWLADLFGSSCNSSITMHASLGRACAAVMIELSSRQPRHAE